MKKFVSMDLINRAFDDILQIDYITVSCVTDSMLTLVIHLKTLRPPDPASREYEVFMERKFVLGRMINREINIRFVPVKWYAWLFQKIFG